MRVFNNECPFCEEKFGTADLLGSHLNNGCAMDSDFSNDSSMEVNVGSDKEEYSDTTAVSFFFFSCMWLLCACVRVRVCVCVCACVLICWCTTKAV